MDAKTQQTLVLRDGEGIVDFGGAGVVDAKCSDPGLGQRARKRRRRVRVTAPLRKELQQKSVEMMLSRRGDGPTALQQSNRRHAGLGCRRV